MGAQEHQSDPKILGARTLERDHRVLARLLQPGMTVLDVGCGVGSIARGIARAVEPGRVVGVDRDKALLAVAREAAGELGNLEFQLKDAKALGFAGEFDLVTAARTLQWIAEPGEVVRELQRAVKENGWVVVLDYNHERNSWSEEPPESFREFYRAFLAWREANGWSNRMGDELAGLFEEAGLREVTVWEADEVEEAADFWPRIVRGLGEKFMPAERCQEVAERYAGWYGSVQPEQRLELRCVVGRRSAPTS